MNMKLKSVIEHLPARALAIALMAAGMSLTTHAATALTGRLIARPLTPGDIATYGLPASTEVSGGLTTVGVGQPVYLEAEVNIAIPSSDITNVTWTLSHKPILSSATLQASPLGMNVPVYEPADKLTYQVAGRMVLRPDVSGYTTNDQYKVTASIYTKSEGTTNVTITITAGTYLGVGLLPGTYGCALCHDNPNPSATAPDKVDPWLNTEHASQFSRGIDGVLSSHYSVSCLPCHTVGYDTNALAVNGGFDDEALAYGWTFPKTLASTNWASMETNYPAVANVANIQCENCHGPGSQHGSAYGNTNFICVDYDSGDCAQCHDSLPKEYEVAEWDNSAHAQMTRVPSGSASRIACVRCHTAMGFEEYVDNLGSSVAYATNYNYEPLTCQGCHDPHDASNPYQLRTGTTVTFNGNTGFTVTNAGLGGFCMNCHNSRNGSATNSIVNYPQGLATWNGGSSFGPHDSPQGDMLEGVNGWTYGQVIPSSPHANVVTNTCVGCHMQSIASTDPAFTLAGGHSTKMSYVNSNNVTVDVTYVCTQCHGNINTFNFPVADYDGDGTIEGVQTEVQNLLNKLSTLLPNASGVVDGLVKTPSPKTTWTVPQLEAAYNWQFVNSDGSLGVHNLAYTVGLLKASIANLTGDANNDGLPDSWQTNYFGSITNPLAAPNACPAGDGIPNWMKYALGLNPMVAGISVNNGVVYQDVTALGDTNVVHIYTAAEVVFDTQPGLYYQIQSIGSLSGGWQNIGNPILGTGGSLSYLTSTRNNVQQFYRVVTTTSP